MSTDARKLMDRLAPQAAWGETVGVVATTFELQPDFVETDFLPTLLGLGAWDDRNWNGRVALEVPVEDLLGRSRSMSQEMAEVQLIARAARPQHPIAHCEKERVHHHVYGERA